MCSLQVPTHISNTYRIALNKELIRKKLVRSEEQEEKSKKSKQTDKKSAEICSHLLNFNENNSN